MFQFQLIRFCIKGYGRVVSNMGLLPAIVGVFRDHGLYSAVIESACLVSETKHFLQRAHKNTNLTWWAPL